MDYLEKKESTNYAPTNDENDNNGLGAVETVSPKTTGLPCPSNLRQFILAAVQKEASDLHLAAGYSPTVRVHGHMMTLDHNAVMTPADILSIFQSITTKEQLTTANTIN